MAKGDVLGVARLVGIMAAKKVDQLIPLAHPLNISNAEINFAFDENASAIDITATVKITGKTGVKMEALTAVAVTALTILRHVQGSGQGHDHQRNQTCEKNRRKKRNISRRHMIQ